MLDNWPIVDKIKALIISSLCFENNRKCLHLKKLNTRKLNSNLCFARYVLQANPSFAHPHI
jgi:hypothetical protein